MYTAIRWTRCISGMDDDPPNRRKEKNPRHFSRRKPPRKVSFEENCSLPPRLPRHLYQHRVRINALVTMCSGRKVVMWESLMVPPHHCGSFIFGTRDEILMIVSTPAADYRPQSRLLKSLIERVQEERDWLIQEASDWRDQTQAFDLFSKQQQAERDLPR